MPDRTADIRGESSGPALPAWSALVVSDRALVRQGIRHVLERDGLAASISEAADAESALLEARRLGPSSVVLLSLTALGPSGLGIVQEILAAAPKARVVLLLLDEGWETVREGFSAGASGALTEEGVPSELASALHEVMRGGRFLGPSLGAQLVTSLDRPSPAHNGLTPRELEILRLIAAGHTSREIAERVGRSHRTIEAHRSRIARKLGLGTRAEIVRYAIDNHLLDRG